MCIHSSHLAYSFTRRDDDALMIIIKVALFNVDIHPILFFLFPQGVTFTRRLVTRTGQNATATTTTAAATTINQFC
jgi:hypothetical protein